MNARELIEKNCPAALGLGLRSLAYLLPADVHNRLESEVALAIDVVDDDIRVGLTLGDEVWEWSADEICELVNGKSGTYPNRGVGSHPELARPGDPGSD